LAFNYGFLTPSPDRGNGSLHISVEGTDLTSPIKTTAVFLQPFELPSLKEILPAGEYEIETELLDPVNWIEPGTWTDSVLVHLHGRVSHPGLCRTLTIPLAELETALAQDKLTGKALTDFFLEEMLADPMIRLVMQADGVSEQDIRKVFACQPGKKASRDNEGGDRGASPEDPGADGQRLPRASSRPGIGE